jgi:hypothetical protein
MEREQYFLICYSGKSRGEVRLTYWNEVTNKSISEFWVDTLNAFAEDEGYMGPVLHNAMPISREDYERLEGKVG